MDKIFATKRISLSELDPSSTTHHQWPFASENRVVDFEHGYTELLNVLFLRNVASGLNDIQEYLVSHYDKSGKNKQVLIAMCSAHFNISPKLTLQEYNNMSHGNFPWPSEAPETILPLALVNQEFPYNPTFVSNAITQWVNFRKHLVWDSEEPFVENFTFVQDIHGKWSSRCKRNAHGEIIQLPYYTNQDDITDLEILSSQNEYPVRYKCKDDLVNTCAWNPVFKEGNFTQAMYLEQWITKKLVVLAEERVILFDNNEYMNKRNQFLRVIWTRQSGISSRGVEYLYYVGETQRSKRLRAISDYGTDKVLDTPIRLLDAEIIHGALPPVPESARAMLLQQLPDSNKNNSHVNYTSDSEDDDKKNVGDGDDTLLFEKQKAHIPPMWEE